MPRRREFSGRVVVVTGGASGLGAAYARRFARDGARLALLDVDGEKAAALAAELEGGGGQALGLGCDVRDEAACTRAIEAVIAFHGIRGGFGSSGLFFSCEGQNSSHDAGSGYRPW